MLSQSSCKTNSHMNWPACDISLHFWPIRSKHKTGWVSAPSSKKSIVFSNRKGAFFYVYLKISKITSNSWLFRLKYTEKEQKFTLILFQIATMPPTKRKQLTWVHGFLAKRKSGSPKPDQQWEYWKVQTQQWEDLQVEVTTDCHSVGPQEVEATQANHWEEVEGGRRNKREYYSIISLRSEKNHVSSFCSHWDNVLQH